MFKGLGNLTTLMKQAQQMGGRMQEINQRLRSERVTASVGAGMVEVEANGLGEIVRLKLDPQLLERGELEMLEDLIPAAVNEAIAKSRQRHAEAMRGLAAGLDLPGLEKAWEQLTGGGEKA